MTVYRNTRLQRRERKGLIFIHEMMLCRNHETLRGIAATESHHLAAAELGTGNSQKPCQIPRINCAVQSARLKEKRKNIIGHVQGWIAGPYLYKDQLGE